MLTEMEIIVNGVTTDEAESNGVEHRHVGVPLSWQASLSVFLALQSALKCTTRKFDSR